jgi:transposase
MTTKLFEPRYDRAFKEKVINEYLVTGCTKMFLIRKYKIQFKSAVQTWMRILGYTDPRQGLQLPKFGKIIFSPLPKQLKTTNKKAADLQKKIRELERQLEDEKLRSEAYARVIDKAEQELKIPIRKKPNTK